MKKNFKNQKGITLIALIITIIVLLILAGVTIAAITGNESAPNKAVEARQKNEEGAELDAIKVAAISSIAEGNYNLKVDLDTLRNSLASLVKETNLETLITGEGPWTVTGVTGKKYIITAKGDVTSYTPTIIKENDTEVELTKENVKDYLGKVVATTTVGEGTSAVTTQYALYYVDFDGTLSNSQVGTVYLKALTNVGRTALNGEISNTNDQNAAVDIMKQINPDWASQDANITYTSISAGGKGAAYLCNENNTLWSILKPQFNEKYGANNVRYVIGAPSVEMLTKAINQAGGLTGSNAVDARWFKGKDANNASTTSKYLAPGYLYSITGRDTTSNTNYDYYSLSNTQENALNNAQKQMYYNKTGYWLASPPSIWNNNYVCFVDTGTYSKCFGFNNYNLGGLSSSLSVCPLVSLKSGVQLTVMT